MSRTTRVLLPAMLVIALCGVATSSALATEDPFLKLNGARLKAKETREVGGKAEGTQVFKSPGAGITITCTGMAAKGGATLNGSEPGEPGTVAGALEYSGCTVAGNGEKCSITSAKGAKDKKFVTNALKGELELNGREAKKGTKIVLLVVPASGSVFVILKFEPEAGGECKFAETSVEGSVAVQILNSKKETVAFEENEAEETFSFGKALPNGTELCKLKEGHLVEPCSKTSFKAFGVASTAEGTAEGFLTGADKGTKLGTFSK